MATNQRAPEGNEFERFVAERGAALLRFAYMLTADPQRAEDVVQDALLKVSRRWDHAGIADPYAYVRRAVLNEFLRWRRLRASQEIVGDVSEMLPRDPSGADAFDEIVQRDVMWRALARLPRRQRSVLVLRYYESLPDDAIASLLGCAEGTVRSLASRAFDALRHDPRLISDSDQLRARREA